MIIDGILQVFLQPLILLLNLLPTLDLTINADISVFVDYLSFANKIFPLKEIMPIFLFNVLVIPSFSIIWTLILKIKSFIPTMGD